VPVHFWNSEAPYLTVLALLITVLAGWLYALVTGWQTPCVRSAAGLTLLSNLTRFQGPQRIRRRSIPKAG
jgi:hypothetical protein